MLQSKTGPSVALKCEGKSLNPQPPPTPREAHGHHQDPHDNRYLIQSRTLIPSLGPSAPEVGSSQGQFPTVPGEVGIAPSRNKKDLYEDNLEEQSEFIPRRLQS